MAKIMRLMSLKQYSKLSKASLVRKIMKAIKKLPKRKLVLMCYELQKSRLPTISTTKKGMPRLTARPKAYRKPRKTKTKAKRKLRAGTITKIKMKIPNGKTRMQKVKVLSSGKYRFMKN